ncbi:late control protein D [Fusobacterium mortiferum]|uniref:Late control protein D n=1 Tax=Fusobacterium mortiferum TaxID=850 RepID=A0A414PRB2_FUSMR|nr:late control protein D [Fusobacterium mortiferum]RHF71074.1 late control protein D [Fusobacterium mortiferum]
MLNLVENSRQLKLEVIYEGANITSYISNDIISFSYSDSFNEFDSIELTIENRDNRWLESWEPLKGEKIAANFILTNWENNKEVVLTLGEFYIDDISYSGPPDIVNIKALSVDITSNIMDEKKSRVWENVTLEKIARDIAIENNLELLFLAEFNREFKRSEQKLESSFNYIKRISKEAGISVKIYSNKLILFEDEMYEKTNPVITLDKTNLFSYQLADDDTDTYSGCKITYFDSKLGEKQEATFYTKQRPGYKRGTQRLLFINEEKYVPGETRKQKEEYLAKIAAKALREKNKNAVKGSISILGKEKFISVGDTINLTGLGNKSGKYIITEVQIEYPSYVMNLQIRKVMEDE